MTISMKTAYVVLACAPAVVAAHDALVLESVSVISVGEGRVTPNQTLVISDGIITALGDAGSVLVPPNGPTDLAGRQVPHAGPH